MKFSNLYLRVQRENSS